MKAIQTAALMAGALAVAGCSQEIGTFDNPHLGFTTQTNARLQNAYGDLEQRRRDLSIAFRAAAPDTVTFPFDSARLTSDARQALDQQAAWLVANDSVLMAIVGHTDAVGAESYNDRLGLRRARAALRYLTSRGVDPARLEAVESRGEREPVVDTQEREERNRRAVTVVVGFDRIYVGTGMNGITANRLYVEYRDDDDDD